MNYKTHICFFSLLLIFSASVNALTEKEVLKKLNQAYLKSTSFSMKVSVSIYKSAKDANAFQTYGGEVKKSGDNYYSKMMGRTTVVNSNSTLIIEEEQKKIIYSKISKSKKQNIEEEQLLILIDTAFNYNKVSFTESNTKEYKIEVIPSDKESMYKSIVYTISATDYTLREMVCNYKTDQEEDSFEKVAIKYSDVQLNGKIPASYFSEQNYVVKTKDKIIAASAYAGYEVIEQKESDYK